jgi:hypothetical protein
VSNLTFAQGVIGGMSASGARVSALPVPWSCQTPVRSRIGTGDGNAFEGVFWGLAWANTADDNDIAATKAAMQYVSKFSGRLRTLSPLSDCGNRRVEKLVVCRKYLQQKPHR